MNRLKSEKAQIMSPTGAVAMSVQEIVASGMARI